MYRKRDNNIRSYDAPDAFYTGTDAEYEEFLKNAGIKMDAGEAEANPESVDNTQRINLNDTINLQNVLDRFKKTAGDLGNTAKTFKDSVATRMDSLKAKKDDAAEEKNAVPQTHPDAYASDSALNAVSDKLQNSMKHSAAKLSEIKNDIEAMSDVPDRVVGVDTKLDHANTALTAAARQLSELAEKLDEIEQKLSEDTRLKEASGDAVKDAVSGINEGISDIRQAVGSVSKLNDSIFDLKNTQLNTKNAIFNLETAFARLKRKCVLGVTVISILSAIIIALEILLLLS